MHGKTSAALQRMFSERGSQLSGGFVQCLSTRLLLPSKWRKAIVTLNFQNWEGPPSRQKPQVYYSYVTNVEVSLKDLCSGAFLATSEIIT